eukprot:scaffold29354_cov62-Cyclotella_meneghiniana.AAC.1
MDTSVGVEVMYRLKYGLDDTCGFHSKETTGGSGPFDDSIKQFTAGVPVRHDVYVFVVFKDIDETTTSLMMDS